MVFFTGERSQGENSLKKGEPRHTVVWAGCSKQDAHKMREEEQNTRTDKTHKYSTTECGGGQFIIPSFCAICVCLFLQPAPSLGGPHLPSCAFTHTQSLPQLHLIYTDVCEKSDTIVG